MLTENECKDLAAKNNMIYNGPQKNKKKEIEYHLFTETHPERRTTIAATTEEEFYSKVYKIKFMYNYEYLRNRVHAARLILLQTLQRKLERLKKSNTILRGKVEEKEIVLIQKEKQKN